MSASCLASSLDVVCYAFGKMADNLNDNQTRSVQSLMTDLG
ncbi:hypothetical protein [Hoylesella marshii]|uniref:Uncharacterized protein n=1 Tax=Hoylesella marshii DSM 16973 = JCM 13450 TaxID=862515 RepID=E0NV63_9BACT|nr:hypothetical protein [Hoylesella marshii]EFM00974.1 hypothetical protein HMPREF0658_2068 [Hoylesella marshii DSM 16973 = JCM 13450]